MNTLPDNLIHALFALLALIRHRLAEREHGAWRATFRDPEHAHEFNLSPVEFERVDYAGLVQLIDAVMIECGDGSTRWIDAYRIEAFQRGELRALVNVNVLSEGFDATHVDAVVMLRPTKSAALYYQQVGRGMRLHPGKADCLVLDFAGNIVEHGPVDAIRPPKKPGEKATSEAPVRECPQCQAIVPVQARQCPDCGHEFPRSAFFDRHDGTASDAPILSTEIVPPVVHHVTGVRYAKHVGKSGIPTLQVTYWCGLRHFREWVCIEHGGWARAKAMTWWMARDPSGLTPRTVEAAVGASKRLRTPATIFVRESGRYPEVVHASFPDPGQARSQDRRAA